MKLFLHPTTGTLGRCLRRAKTSPSSQTDFISRWCKIAKEVIVPDIFQLLFFAPVCVNNTPTTTVHFQRLHTLTRARSFLHALKSLCVVQTRDLLVGQVSHRVQKIETVHTQSQWIASPICTHTWRCTTRPLMSQSTRTPSTTCRPTLSIASPVPKLRTPRLRSLFRCVAERASPTGCDPKAHEQFEDPTCGVAP